MEAWWQIRQYLPRSIDVEQEKMLREPATVAIEIASFLGVPSYANLIGESLSSGRREWSGAGVGKTSLVETGWSRIQMEIFLDSCGPIMSKFGYELSN